VIEDTAGVVTGQTFTLTAGSDIINGTDGNDIIVAYIDAAGNNDTFTAADVIDGQGGNDTLLITTDGNGAGALPAAIISNIETYSIREVGGGAGTYNFALVNGETEVVNRVSTDNVTFNNIATGAELTIQGDGTTNIGNTTFTMANATDAVTINIEGGTNGGNITRNATGDTQIVINSKGANNTVGTIDLDTGTALTALTINAETNLTASLAADYAAGATLTVTGAGTVNLTGATLSANFASVNAQNNTGGTWVVLGANTTAFTGGSGNDVVGVDASVFNGSVVVDAGAGTDTVRFTDQAALTNVTAANIRNFEILRVADDTDGGADAFDVSLLSGITGIEIDGVAAAADAITLNNVTAAQAQNIQIRGTDNAGPIINVTGASTVGQIDTLSLEINDDLTATNTLTVANLTAAGVEKLNVNAVDNFTLQSMTGMGALNEATFTGTGNVNVTTGALALNVNTIVDASQLTGQFTFNASGATTNGLAITGSATNQNTITGTAQADSITGGSANDQITAGNGIDQINISQGGDDLIVMSGITAAVNRDVITGFTAGAYQANVGIDRIEVQDAQATTAFGVNAATFQNISSAPTAAVTFTTGAANVLEIDYDMTGAANDLDNATDGTNLLANLGQTLAVASDQDMGYIIAYQDGNAYLYHVAEGGDGDTNVAAADIALVGVFNNIAVGAFDASNIVDTSNTL